MSHQPALAIFVKTPGLSPIKTRFAADLGQVAAEEFYRRCVAAVEAVARDAIARLGIHAVWAIAEPHGMENPCWRSFDRIAQGHGGLGERLNQVYRTLLEDHPAVLLVGADAPLISSGLIGAAADVLGHRKTPFAISRSADGGYALFGGSRPVSRKIWLDVPYSTSRTAARFVRGLRTVGAVKEMAPLDDVDTADDLARLALIKSTILLPEQQAVVSLARDLIGGLNLDTASY